MLEKIIEKAEAKILNSLGDRLAIETHFDDKNMILTTSTYWDDILVSEHEFSLEEMADAIERRIMDKLEK